MEEKVKVRCRTDIGRWGTGKGERGKGKRIEEEKGRLHGGGRRGLGVVGRTWGGSGEECESDCLQLNWLKMQMYCRIGRCYFWRGIGGITDEICLGAGKGSGRAGGERAAGLEVGEAGEAGGSRARGHGQEDSMKKGGRG